MYGHLQGRFRELSAKGHLCEWGRARIKLVRDASDNGNGQ